MSTARSYKATLQDENERLDVLLSERGLYASRSAAARAIEAGRVFVSGAAATKKTKLQAGQMVVYEIDEAEVQTPLRGEPIELDIRYEDDDLLVLSKQAGLICHPSDDHREGTLVNALIYKYGAQGLCNVQGEQDRLGIVHRLDMDTSGLMLAAKTDCAGQELMQMIAQRVVDRRYKALVHGVIAANTGMIDAPIARHAKDRKRMAVRECDSAREAVTTFEVLERFDAHEHDNGYTLLDCKLFTGRTHQIRVHMEYTGHPLVGDQLYTTHAPKKERAHLNLGRQFLHSYKLGFEHPFTHEYLEFQDELPQDLQLILDELRARE